MWRPRTLLITDANLGRQANARLSRVCDDLTWLSWDMGGGQASAEPISTIAAGEWDLAISFYSDLVLPLACLQAIAVPLNIHPALPRIRGVAHDVLPLVERHSAVGTTLHRMERTVDTGQIYRIVEERLPPDQTYHAIRALNQVLSLRMLDTLCGMLDETVALPHLEARLAAMAATTPQAWGSYYSRKHVAELRARHNLDCVPQAGAVTGKGEATTPLA
jgi:methionyl-tRNA formyltransferase